MISLTITKPAAELISEALRRSTISDPVVQLLVQGDASPVNPELARAILSGATESVVRELTLRLHGDDLRKQRKRLLPAIFPRHQIPKECLVEVSGFVIAFPSAMIANMNDWTLEVVKDGGLALKDADGNIVMPPESGTARE